MNSTIINNFPFVVSEERRRKERLGMDRFIERIHSRVQQPCNCIGTKESVYIKKEFNSHRIANSGTRELTLKCKLKCYFKPMNNPLGVSPSKGKQGTTRGKEKIF